MKFMPNKVMHDRPLVRLAVSALSLLALVSTLAGSTSVSGSRQAPEADMRIILHSFPSAVAEGSEVHYVFEVRNDGPSAATDVTLTMPLPDGAVNMSGTFSPPCFGGAVAECDLGSISQMGGALVNVVVRFGVVAPGALDLTATVSSPIADPDINNNSVTMTTIVLGEGEVAADLGLEIEGPEEAGPGSETTYRISVANSGPSDADGVILRVTLPSGVVFLPQDSSPVCTGDVTISCKWGTLAHAGISEEAPELEIAVRFRGEAKRSLDVTAVVESSVWDPNLDNNASVARTQIIDEVNLSSDLDVYFSSWFTQATADSEQTYSIEVYNAGPSDAMGVVMNTYVPSGWTLLSASGAECESAATPVLPEYPFAYPGQPSTATVLTCALGTVWVGEWRTVELKVNVGPAEKMEIAVFGFSDLDDPRPWTNERREEVLVLAAGEPTPTATPEPTITATPEPTTLRQRRRSQQSPRQRRRSQQPLRQRRRSQQSPRQRRRSQQPLRQRRRSQQSPRQRRRSQQSLRQRRRSQQSPRQRRRSQHIIRYRCLMNRRMQR